MGLSKEECEALIQYHMGRIGQGLTPYSGLGHLGGNDLQEQFDRIDTFVQAIKVIEMTQLGDAPKE